MRRKAIIAVAFLLCLSACTLNILDLLDITIIDVAYLDAEILSVWLKNAPAGYYAAVEDKFYSCEMLDDPPEVLKCTGPGFDPGQEVTIRLYEIGTDDGPLVELPFTVPELPEEPEDKDSDGVPDLEDGCPSDAEKTSPGICGCDADDIDSDEDGTPDCMDTCPSDPDKSSPGECGCNVEEKDTQV